MKITGKTRLTGIIGWPLSHTLSPAMHNAAFEHAGIDLCYVPFPVKEEDFDRAIKGIAALGIAGLNVTIPYKEKIVSYLSELSREARLIGAVNTIKVIEDRMIGYNTDGTGFITSVEEVGYRVEGRSVLIIGAGGAARAVSFQLAIEGVREIVIANRSVDKAVRLKEAINLHFPSLPIQAVDLSRETLRVVTEEIDMVVNATSLGLEKEDPSPIPFEFIHSHMFVCDLIYNPVETTLLKYARDRGCIYINGIGMLIHQGAASFKIWTGITPPIEVMKRAIEENLKVT